MPPLVSILIPAYNAEKWLRSTVTSALAQSWPKKEVVVVDDGSSDGTLRVAREFESGGVKVISQTNAGAAAARNRALAQAQGEYIQWLDADDLLASDKIERQLELGEDPQRLLSSSFGRFYYRTEKARFTPSSLWRDSEPVQWFLTKFNDDVSMVPCTWLVSRTLTEKAGPWDERLSLDDDGEYFGRVVAASTGVTFASKARCYYRQTNAASISRTINERSCQSLFTSYRLCIGYLLALEDSERTRAASVRYLQNNLIYFYPESVELLQQISSLAGELGGGLTAPTLGAKYLLVSRLFGPHAAKKTAFALRSYRDNILKAYDLLLQHCSFGRDS